MKMSPEQRKIAKDLRLIVRDVRDIEKQMKAASFRHLSKYSQKLIKQQYAELMEKQMNLICELI